jgi:selenobiotic family peptide radical SAM maturase
MATHEAKGSNALRAVFPVTCSMAGTAAMAAVEQEVLEDMESVPEALNKGRCAGGPPFCADLARIELAVFNSRRLSIAEPDADAPEVNTSLQVLPVSWRNLPALLDPDRSEGEAVVPGDETLLIWRMPRDGTVMVRPASGEDLLALKLAVEKHRLEDVAAAENADPAVLEAVLALAAEKGLLVVPAPRIRRDLLLFNNAVPESCVYSTADIFTLQWHITQSCDLRCAHCYDRSDRQRLEFSSALHVLDELDAFCRKKYVTGQVSFTGGNPLMYPKFLELYRETAARGFATAILGNPAPRALVEKIISIKKPAYFQVSLEGLEEHNDRMRGEGHFARTMKFLDILKELGITSTVMLTLTGDNMAQVLPLADVLAGRADEFTFNRLSLTGEGARLAMPEADGYRRFLEEYHRASLRNALLGMKDSLFNILRFEAGQSLLGGCAGHGCGAAFNFMALLSDGEVHACRKFPSLIGRQGERTLLEIYDSEEARRYRAGSAACRECPLALVCRGCPAAAYGAGLDVFTAKDPYCFFTAGARSGG